MSKKILLLYFFFNLFLFILNCVIGNLPGAIITGIVTSIFLIVWSRSPND